MKHILKIFILLIGFVLYFNASSFANINIGAYGGYVFSGNIDDGGYGDYDFTGPQFGAKANYNIQLSESIDLGLGVFFQYSSYEDEESYKFSRSAFGLDVNLIFSAYSESGYYPYVRGTFSFYDKLEPEFGEEISGKGFGIGGGIEFDIYPNLRLFGELMYEMPSYDYDIEVTAIAINVGIKFLI